MSAYGRLLIVCTFVTTAHAQLEQTCAGYNMMEMRAILSQAIAKARASLGNQKRLNEYLSTIGMTSTLNHLSANTFPIILSVENILFCSS